MASKSIVEAGSFPNQVEAVVVGERITREWGKKGPRIAPARCPHGACSPHPVLGSL
ncbi:MAG: hypothetical protein ACKO8O_01735 [Betaproteobacteria bacterium]